MLKTYADGLYYVGFLVCIIEYNFSQKLILFVDLVIWSPLNSFYLKIVLETLKDIFNIKKIYINSIDKIQHFYQ